MKLLKFLPIIFVLLSLNGMGQRYNMDVGFKVGASNYLGDIGGKEQTRRDFVMDMKLNQTRWSFGGFFRYRFNMLHGINVGFTYFRVQGFDNESSNPGRVGRNLNFRNDVLDLSVRYEFYPPFLYLADVGRVGRYRTDFQAYAFAGVSGFYNNPKGQLNGEWHSLRPLMTEGEKYSPIAVSMPLGAGFYFTYDKRHRFGFEYYWALAFTDYMDDISGDYASPSEMADNPLAAEIANGRDELGEGEAPPPSNYEPGQKRGDPTHNDNYMLMQVTYSYTLKGRNSFYRSNYNWLHGRRGRFKRVKAKF